MHVYVFLVMKGKIIVIAFEFTDIMGVVGEGCCTDYHRGPCTHGKDDRAPDGDCFKFCTTEMLFAKIMMCAIALVDINSTDYSLARSRRGATERGWCRCRTIGGETDLFKDNILREGRQLLYVLAPLCCFNGIVLDIYPVNVHHHTNDKNLTM
ncbi:hypothetical protein Goshw_022388 [Gossypium schwendimanii]|uniref:Uncharacterized protein n=1 Tax=Gossypium schwendimanii TaxID=34291 RepID=A0A7J9ND25_GOSSC|nr:hypothetical protein [Gossypium schwendimanii]